MSKKNLIFPWLFFYLQSGMHKYLALKLADNGLGSCHIAFIG